jgi:hypothetical protein
MKSPSRRTLSHRLVRGVAALGAVFVLLVVAAVIVVVVNGWRDFGQRATGPRRARMEASPQWRDKHFVNPQPLRNTFWPMVKDGLQADANVSPNRPLPVVRTPPSLLDTPPASGLRVTWFGHSAVLLEIDGQRVLIDPVWSERASPLTWVGPRRWFTPPVALEDLPAIAAVVVSHDHYDHLDRRSITTLAEIAARKGWSTRFVVPLGVGAHLAGMGCARGPHRRARLVGADGSRLACRAHRLHAGAPRIGPHDRRRRRQAVGRICVRRPSPPDLLLGRHGPVPGPA